MRYTINLRTDAFTPYVHGFIWQSYRYNALKHLVKGMWKRQEYGYFERYCLEMQCGKKYDPYRSMIVSRDMKDIQSFCPECLKLYHKIRFSTNPFNSSGA